jgi:hypothetical protein
MEKKNERKRKALNEAPSLEAQERLIEIMTDSPRIRNFAGKDWEIRALKPGTQYLIAQQAVSICKAESANYEDVIRQFAANAPAVVTVLTLALLNDRERIFANGHSGAYSDEFHAVYETIMWDTSSSEWIGLLVDFLSMLDIEVFFSTTSSIQILRQRLLERKMTMEEQKQLLQEQNGGK